MIAPHASWDPSHPHSEERLSTETPFLNPFYASYIGQNPLFRDTDRDNQSIPMNSLSNTYSLNPNPTIPPTMIPSNVSRPTNFLGARCSIQTRSQAKYAQFDNITTIFQRKNITDGSRTHGVCSRASYMCRKCKTHGHNIPVKRHKRACPYMNCSCLKCQLVDQGRKVVARQIALYRDQKGGPSKDSADCSLQTRSQRTNIRDWNQRIHLGETSSDIMDDGLLPTKRLMEGNLRQNLTSSKLKLPNILGPHCRRCRNHSLAVTWKGHKKTCPFRNCPCDPCRLINVRKDTEKTLREIAGVNHAIEKTDQPSNKMFMSEDRNNTQLPFASSQFAHARRKVERSLKGKTTAASNIIPEYKMDGSENDRCSSTTLSESAKVPEGASDDNRIQLRNSHTSTPLNTSRLTQASAQSSPTNFLASRPFGNVPFVYSHWPTRREQEHSNVPTWDLDVPTELIFNPVTNNATIETNHFHHHHHHHVHITNPPSPYSNKTNGYNSRQGDDIPSQKGTCRVSAPFLYSMMPDQADDYSTDLHAPSYTEQQQSASKFRRIPPSNISELVPLDRTKSHGNGPTVGSRLISDQKSGYCPVQSENICYTNRYGYGMDTNMDSAFYCSDRVSAVAAAAAAAAAMVAMTPPLGTASLRRHPADNCYNNSCNRSNNAVYAPFEIHPCAESQSRNEAIYRGNGDYFPLDNSFGSKCNSIEFYPKNSLPIELYQATMMKNYGPVADPVEKGTSPLENPSNWLSQHMQLPQNTDLSPCPMREGSPACNSANSEQNRMDTEQFCIADARNASTRTPSTNFHCNPDEASRVEEDCSISPNVRQPNLSIFDQEANTILNAQQFQTTEESEYRRPLEKFYRKNFQVYEAIQQLNNGVTENQNSETQREPPNMGGIEVVDSNPQS